MVKSSLNFNEFFDAEANHASWYLTKTFDLSLDLYLNINNIHVAETCSHFF